MGGLVVEAPARITADGSTAPAIGPHNRPWIARIDGTDARYGLRRRFCQRDDAGANWRGRRGTHAFQMQGPGLYEYRNFAYSDGPKSGFVLIDKRGGVTPVSSERARAMARTLDHPDCWQSDGRPDVGQLETDTETETPKPC